MTTLSFGAFRFDDKAHLLLRGGQPVLIGRRSAGLLAAFLSHRGEVLTKAQLMDGAWGGRTVEESNLSVQIATLRRILGKTPDGGDWIKTVPRVGYRFEAEERDLAAVPDADGPAIVVLPFADLSDDGVGTRLADRVVEDLTTALSRFKSISVIARTSAYRFRGEAFDVREVAANLGARYVLEGSVRRDGDKTRVSAQLIDGAAGAHVWADNFDGGNRDHDDVIGRVAAAVEPRITGAEIIRSRRDRPQSQVAYDLYLRALQHGSLSSPAGHRAAYGLLKEALRLEPENVRFLARACELLHHRIAVGWATPIGPDDRQESLELAERGLRLAGTDASSVALFGMGLITAGERERGYHVVQHAVGLNENCTMALSCGGLANAWMGRFDDAEQHYSRAARLGRNDPNLKFALGGLSAIYRVREDLEGSLRVAKLAFAVNPNYAGTVWTLIASNAYLGRMDDARRYMAHYRSVAPDATLAGIEAGQPAEAKPLRKLLAGLRLAGMPEGSTPMAAQTGSANQEKTNPATLR